MGHKIFLNIPQSPIEGTFVPEWDMDIIRRSCAQEMNLGSLAQNKVSMTLIPKIGLEP